MANIVDTIYQQKRRKSKLSMGVSVEIVSFENLYLTMNKNIAMEIK
ncbi:MAG: hypothetical protein N3E50_03140 [Candidatus Goldbacteria bacterium]|nr:hypothetical protein [Candidatus Goldiibacteriota bacterium]